MGRLIDADALCEKIRKIYDGYMLDEGCTPIEFENMVDEQPTAYDVEKVVAVLQECSDKYKNSSCEYEQGKSFAYKNSIDIVKRGGVE